MKGGVGGGGGEALRAERRDRAAGRKAALFALPAAGGPEPGAEGWRHAGTYRSRRRRGARAARTSKPESVLRSPAGPCHQPAAQRREHDPPPPPKRSRSRRRRRERGRAEPRPAPAGAAAWGALAARARAPLPPARPRSHEPPPASASFPRAAPLPPPRLRSAAAAHWRPERMHSLPAAAGRAGGAAAPDGGGGGGGRPVPAPPLSPPSTAAAGFRLAFDCLGVAADAAATQLEPRPRGGLVTEPS